MYADWLDHDADGLAFNLLHPQPFDDATDILARARARLVHALSLIDRALDASSCPARTGDCVISNVEQLPQVAFRGETSVVPMTPPPSTTSADVRRSRCEDV
jgi:hypothetical protein